MRMRLLIPAVAFVAVLASSGCSGGGSSNSLAPLPSSGGVSLSGPSPTSPTHIYLQDFVSVFVWPIKASGDVAPTLEISGSTGCVIGFPAGVAVDLAGTVFVTDNAAPLPIEPTAVEEYQINFATSKAAFISAIHGANTGLASVHNDAVDSHGNVYVTDVESVHEYAAGATGNTPAIAEIRGPNTGLNVVAGGEGPIGITVDSQGTIYAVTRFFGSPPFGAVLVFAPGSNGDVAPVAVISGNNTRLSNPFGVALDRAGNIYVANDSASGVTVYAAGANGNVAPIRQIIGANTTLGDSAGIALDDSGKIYVSTKVSTTARIAVFAAGANGNAVPLNTIEGANTKMFTPGQITLH